MRRVAWVWVLVALLAGLLPGAAVSWLLWRANTESRAQLVSRNATLHGDNTQLQARLNAAEASISVLTRKTEQQQLQNTVAAPTSAAATSAATPSGPPNITERSVSPQQVAAGGSLALSVKLTGHADKVNVRVVGSDGTFDKTYFLGRTATGATGEEWGKTIAAPDKAGEYRYYAIAYLGGTKYPMPGVSGWTFLVK